MSFHYNAKGIAYVSLQWTFTLIQILVISLRVYSRTLLTRSVGSDDFLIVVAFCLNLAATVSDLEGFLSGWSQHESFLSPEQDASATKWEYIGYIEAYIVYFLIRASVMLFVLRLLPSYKVWQQRVVLAAFTLNLLVTAYTCFVFGFSCIPFQANWEDIPNAKCFSKDLIVITNQINAALACVCDIATAIVPQFLLWGIQMRSRTKRQLNFIFALGLITAALSIARASTITKKTVNEDPTWNMIPAYYFSCFEGNLGMILACGPALRQFWAYRSRTHTSLPSKERQYPNQDFEKMRRRVNLRDILWYRKAHMTGNRVFDAAPMFRTPPPDGSSNDPQTSSQVSNSVLDFWEKKVLRLFGAGRSAKSGSSETTKIEDSEKQASSQSSNPDDLPQRKPQGSRKWGLFSSQSESSSGSSNGATFLLSGTTAGGSTTMTQDEPFPPLRESASEASRLRVDPIHTVSGV